ncbi:hypothetical protein AGDE_06162 [Angomonas deanei]|nr:hypothetical protein AGDE_06162 [Angomonas deanei]|eukprot:EPY37772.1 hypothetical protein AGDE_06162 [Angomonas deanei]
MEAAGRLTASLKGEAREYLEIHSKCPFFVVLRTATAIPDGGELTYRYVDPADPLYHDNVYWASRFSLFPSSGWDDKMKSSFHL